MRTTRKEKRIILTCLEEIWECWFDKPFFEGEKEETRNRLILKLKKELEESG